MDGDQAAQRRLVQLTQVQNIMPFCCLFVFFLLLLPEYGVK